MALGETCPRIVTEIGWLGATEPKEQATFWPVTVQEPDVVDTPVIANVAGRVSETVAFWASDGPMLRIARV